MILAAAAFAALLQVSSAHICMWSPPQREGAGQIAYPGEHVCYLKEGPCGGVPSGEPMATIEGGSDYHILFQQNLNHFYVDNPGSFVADYAEVADPAEEDFKPLGTPIPDYNAMNEITQTNFTYPVTVPNIDCPHCVLRMRYLSQNPTENDRGTTFYQCADVSITKSSSVSSTPVTAEHVEGGSDCCAAASFTMQGYETGSWRHTTTLSYYFDTPSQQFRIDSNSGTGDSSIDGNFQMYSNFTSGIEYYYDVNNDVCDLYGLNLWSDWCYGEVNAQSYLNSIRVGNEVADVWSMKGNDFTWTNARRGCVPIGKNRPSTGETTVYYNYKVGAPDASVFELPAACVSAQEKLLARTGRISRDSLPKRSRNLM